MGQFFDELKRRNVFRVALAYVVTSWLLLQVADLFLNNIRAPAWVFSVFVLALVLGFVPALVFAWAYELTPEGIRKEREVDRSKSITRTTGRKLDLITIAMLVAVVAFVLVERILVPDTLTGGMPEEEAAAQPEVTTTSVDDKSIAVLAFDDLSPEGDQAYFTEGLSEEILNVLAQVPGIKVAGRTSSFAFQGKDTDLREIGEILNVAHILEGSVRKVGDRIRVTAQLIQASDGFHLFSRTYDRELTDVFEVQDDIASMIGKALETQLVGSGGIPAVPETSVEAYDRYLLARQRVRTRNLELMREAVGLLDEALAIDPDYAPALAQKAQALYLLSDDAYGTIPDSMARDEGLELVGRALEIDPNLAEAHAVRGLLLHDQGRENHAEAIASLERALALNPNMDDGKLWLANAIDDKARARQLYEELVSLDPLYAPAFLNLTARYVILGNFDVAEALIRRVARITGPDANFHQALGVVAFAQGDLSEALENLDDAFDVRPDSKVLRMWLGFTLFQVGDMQRAADLAPTDIALLARASLGEFETADLLIEESDIESGDRARAIAHVTAYLAVQDRFDEAIDIVNNKYGNAQALVDSVSVVGHPGTSYLGPLAYVYRVKGLDSEYTAILQRMGEVLDLQHENGHDNYLFWVSRTQYAVLTDDRDAAAGYLQRALDAGYASVELVDPVLESVADEPRFEALLAEIVAAANRERAELGWEPYRPALRLEQ